MARPSQRQLLDAYNRISARLVRGVGDRLSTGFVSLGSWRDEDFDRFLPAALGVVTGAQMQAARLQVAFYQQMALAAGEEFRSSLIDPADYTSELLRNGTPATTVYRRPFVDVYRSLDDGKSLTQAIRAGSLRIRSIASTDVQLARRNAGFQARSGNARIVGYARTLTGAENCALCFVASTQRYTRGELLPIHPGCDCGEMPIFGDQDPGQVINQARLDATHEAVQTRFGVRDAGARDPDYAKITIREHGELGPLLTVADQDFTGPGDI